jgi:CheY-like chemotaxis protein
MSHTPLKSDTILLADDEPYNLQWIIDWIESLKLKTVVAENVDSAIQQLQEARFRTVVADLSIPLLPPQRLLQGMDPLFSRYPGLVVADYARNHDHTARQVVVYSVHDDPLIRPISEKLGFTYILKGRPRILKIELGDILKYDPRTGTRVAAPIAARDPSGS